MIPARTDLRPPAPGSPAVAGHQDALDGLRAVAAVRGPRHPRRRADRIRAHRHACLMGGQQGQHRRPDFLRALRPAAVPAMGGRRSRRAACGPGDYLPAAAGAADPARVLGRGAHCLAGPQPGPGPARLAVDPVPAADPELRHPCVVARDRRARAGPGLEPGRGGVLLPGPATARGGPHLVRLPRAARR